ncbi:MAG: cytochrome C oxidase subunit I, partial [Gammaproteobacteria bacterium]|nr:cytochrome C oxidase subunit I [Gammaproteobacteria bacterium]
ATGEYFFELLFWGSGHTLQFVHVQLLLVSWLVLSVAAGIIPKLQPRLTVFLFALGLVPVMATIVVYMMFDVGSGNHMQAISWLMQYGGGMAALPMGLLIIYSIFSAKKARLAASGERNALFFSLILFAVGGVFGFMISGSNVIVPAHYHGSIIAITIAFMGLTYHLLPRLGFRKPEGRMVCWQPVVLGVGQLMHIGGLAWSGGYGVQRKTAGAAQGLDVLEKKISMGVMGMGALVAVIGGIMFMIIVYKSTRAGKNI